MLFTSILVVVAMVFFLIGLEIIAGIAAVVFVVRMWFHIRDLVARVDLSNAEELGRKAHEAAGGMATSALAGGKVVGSFVKGFAGPFAAWVFVPSSSEDPDEEYVADDDGEVDQDDSLGVPDQHVSE